MKVRANVAYARFRRRFAERGDLVTPWKGAAYRVTSLDYPRPDSILRGEGSFLHGGRWNAPGSFRAVYGSTTDVVAVAESRATADYAGIPYPFRTPRLLVTIELDVPRALDLTSLAAQQAFGFTLAEMCGEDWRKSQEAGFESVTQAFGRALFESGLNAALVPSARVPEGVNVVYFPENKSGSEDAQVCESEKLDRIRGK